MALLLVSPRYSPPNDVRSIGNPDHKLVARRVVRACRRWFAPGSTVHTQRCAPANAWPRQTNRAHRRNLAANEQQLRYAAGVL